MKEELNLEKGNLFNYICNMFRTEITPNKSEFNISHSDQIMSFGSCFANSIGEKLEINKFNVFKNPFGIIYNPISIFNLLNDIINDSVNIEDSIVQNNSIYHSLLLHSSHSHKHKEALLSSFNNISENLKKEIKTTDYIFFTFGSAFIYKHLKSGIDVANCHKINANEFEKRLLSIEEVTTSFYSFFNTVKKINPGIKIIFTVSPVRHIKDGIENNNLSKSILRLAIKDIQEKYKNTYYFPSFEILIDDLRDYRFYKDDLLHPTEFAENYIWEKFKLSYLSDASIDLINQWQKIKTSLNHKPFNLESTEHQKFLKKLLQKLQSFPLDCSEEIKNVKSQIL